MLDTARSNSADTPGEAMYLACTHEGRPRHAHVKSQKHTTVCTVSLLNEGNEIAYLVPYLKMYLCVRGCPVVLTKTASAYEVMPEVLKRHIPI